MAETINQDAFINVIREGVLHKKALTQFAVSFAENFNSLQNTISDCSQLKNPEFKAITTAQSRILAIAKALAHFYCESAVETCDKVVYELANYKGTLYPEKTLARIFNEEDSFWRAEFNDMLKTGPSAALSKHKVADLEDLLSKTDDVQSPSAFKSVLAQLKEMKGMVRGQKISKLMDSFLAALLHTVKASHVGYVLPCCVLLYATVSLYAMAMPVCG